jgi:hypothetical protein
MRLPLCLSFIITHDEKGKAMKKAFPCLPVSAATRGMRSSGGGI